MLCTYLRRTFAVEAIYLKPSAANPRAVRAYAKAGFVPTTLSDEEALEVYGPKDDFDSIYMFMDLAGETLA